MYSENRVFGDYNSKNRCLQNPIFAVNFAQTFLQCLPLLTHRVLGSNPAFEQNRIFAEFFAVYRENRVFRPQKLKIFTSKILFYFNMSRIEKILNFLVSVGSSMNCRGFDSL
jgi:hypothetical protein